MSHIEKCLMDMGCTSIVKDCQDKRVVGITFCLLVNGHTIAFKMPANIDKVFNLMWNKIKNKSNASREKYMKQAERTAWKNISEWVHIQCTLVMMEQVEPLQIFMPYMLLKSGETAFDSMKNNPKLLG
jgi:hypothetical protein